MTRPPKGTPTSTNIFTLASHVRADGTVPLTVPSTSARHLKRCLAAGLIAAGDKGGLAITDEGIAAIRSDNWHPTNREALKRLGK